MANTCGGADASVPPEIEAVMKDLIRKKPQHREYFDASAENAGQHSCLLEDLGGTRCPDGKCMYNRKPGTDEAPLTSILSSNKRI